MNAILKRREESPQMKTETLTVVTCSAGNMGQAVSYAAKVLNCKGGGDTCLVSYGFRNFIQKTHFCEEL